MSLQKPTLVIFDMDGTTVRHINPKWLTFFEALDDALYFIRKVISKRSLPGKKRKRQPSLLAHRVLHKFRNKPVEQIVQPCPGVVKVLEKLWQMNIPMAIVSNSLGKGYGHDILEKFDLARYFSAEVFREDFVYSKPNPEPLQVALKQLNFVPDEAAHIWIIGDRTKDIMAAQALAPLMAPASVFPLAYGLNASIAVLKAHMGTDHIISSYFELLKKINTLPEAPV